ncbi:MAG: rod shape-determining protein MreC [Candidatus Berkelbacteria bacterium Licking1014_2]|uniref:Cell shape-determining protein MreC n=1 Tax=Candidatus Berkelbacteria bacterium Licking1014_2 TaxID=2017146 RepID=A0A554LWB3_9BACT|nr:MAG: rod shape-determining protein MreC [Candidatus Berkelbacteria bacterium Licking1014_2]
MNYRLLYFSLIIAIIGFCLPPAWPAKVRGIVWRPLIPLASRTTKLAAKTKIYGQNLIKINGLVLENEQLRLENSELTSRLSQLQETEKENIFLRQELNLSAVVGGGEDKIIAPIIARTASGANQELLLGKGKDDGLKIDQAVLSQGFLVGKITGVEAKTATVNLIFSPNSLISVLTEKNRAQGILRGGLTGLYIYDLPVGTTVEKDELVLTSGLAGEIKPGLPVGKIMAVNRSGSEIFQQAELSTNIDVNQINFVTIIK